MNRFFAKSELKFCLFKKYSTQFEVKFTKEQIRYSYFIKIPMQLETTVWFWTKLRLKCAFN